MHRSVEDLTLQERQALVKVIAQKKAGLVDQDWSEICEEYGLDISADTLRKAGVGVKLVADARMLAEEKAATVSDLSNGYVDRQMLRDLTRQVNKVYRAEARSKLIREVIGEAIADLPDIHVRSVDERVVEDGRKQSLVLALGDFHYGADILVNGLRGEVINQYDHTVFEERMDMLLSRILEISLREHFADIHVFFVGDLIDGMLRQSQLMRLEYGMVESTVRLSEYLAQWLNALSDLGRVHVYACTGNHSEIRPLKSKNREFEDENLEKVILWYLKERLHENKDISFCGDGQRMVMADIEGYSFLLLHGDGEKSIDQIAKDAINMYGEPVDYFICGHKHREQEFPMGMTDDGNSVIVRTPSLCGVDRYAQSKGYGGKPGAVAMIMERGRGRCCVYPITL